MISPDESVGPGKQVGDYVIAELIAIGGFGTVWRAVHARSAVVAAVKVLHAHLISSETLVLRFEREAHAITSMHHPHIVELYEHGRLPDGRPYLVMEYLAGQDLGTFIARHGTLAADRVAAILDELGAALSAAHEHGIIHRDLKASNVFLCQRDGAFRVVLFDFGIAKLIDDQGPRLTLSSSLLGSPACMSPEQILGKPVDARTDVYALGSLTYQMLVGHPPFSGSSQTAILTMHLDEYPPPPSHYGDVSPAFDSVVMKAMQKVPDARFQSTQDLVAAFRAALTGSQTEGARPGGASAPVLVLGLYIEARADAELLADPDDALLDSLEAVTVEAARVLEPRGFVLARERGNTALFVLPLPDDPAASVAARRREVNTALSLFEVVQARPGQDARVTVDVYLHLDEGSIDDQDTVHGKILEALAWLPETRASLASRDAAVFASTEVLHELGLTSYPVAPASRMHVIEDPAAAYRSASSSRGPRSA